MLRRTAIRRRRPTPRRNERLLDLAYIMWVKTLPCVAVALIPGHRCAGVIEADHVLPRPLGRKCSDKFGVIPLCTLAHRQRTDQCGPFRPFNRDQMRAFVVDALAMTAAHFATTEATV